MAENFIASLFGSRGIPGFLPQQAVPPPGVTQQPPPASKKYIESLVPKAVTEDDVQESNNKECSICLDDHEIGALAVKLPCGHLFHKACISEWLVKHCTCPACRYEVECSDPRYEVDRRRRMQKTRKIRVRKDELKAMKISEIRKVASEIGIDMSDCIDKNEIIDKLAASDSVDLIEGVPVLDIPEIEWDAIGVKGLRNLLKGYGISDKDVLMKSELRSLLLNSGRIRVTPTEVEVTPAGAPNESVPSPTQATAPLLAEEKEELSWVYVPAPDSDAHTGGSADTSTTRPITTSDSDDMDVQSPRESAQSSASEAQFQLSRDLLMNLSIRELKSIMEAYGISTDNCLERQDLIDKMSQNSRITIMED